MQMTTQYQQCMTDLRDKSAVHTASHELEKYDLAYTLRQAIMSLSSSVPCSEHVKALWLG
jgi:hypothetical protein